MKHRIKKGDPPGSGPPVNVKGPLVRQHQSGGPGQKSDKELISYKYSKKSAKSQAQTPNNLIVEFEQAKAGMRDAVDPDTWVDCFMLYCELWPVVFAQRMESIND